MVLRIISGGIAGDIRVSCGLDGAAEAVILMYVCMRRYQSGKGCAALRDVSKIWL